MPRIVGLDQRGVPEDAGVCLIEVDMLGGLFGACGEVQNLNPGSLCGLGLDCGEPGSDLQLGNLGFLGEQLQDTVLYPDKLIRVRVPEDSVLPKFLELVANCPQFRDSIRHAIKTAAGQHGISGADLKRAPVPLPGLNEQREIVRRIETAFAWIDRLASEATSARKLIDHLDQAVLSKAFRGELVPQDSNDEPASVLLERIRAERAGKSDARQRRGQVHANDERLL